MVGGSIEPPTTVMCHCCLHLRPERWRIYPVGVANTSVGLDSTVCASVEGHRGAGDPITIPLETHSHWTKELIQGGGTRLGTRWEMAPPIARQLPRH